MVLFGGAEFMLFWHVRIALLVFFSVAQLLEGRFCCVEQVFGHRVILEHKRYHGLGMDALVTLALGRRPLFWLGHGCSSRRMLLEHQHYFGLGLDALVIVCSRNTNAPMVWAWMLRSPYAPRTQKCKMW